jgi:hypothetical protein
MDAGRWPSKQVTIAAQMACPPLGRGPLVVRTGQFRPGHVGKKTQEFIHQGSASFRPSSYGLKSAEFMPNNGLSCIFNLWNKEGLTDWGKALLNRFDA